MDCLGGLRGFGGLGGLEGVEGVEEIETPVRVDGNVGTEPAALTSRPVSLRVIRVDCVNNLAFWVELNMDTLDVRGHMGSSSLRARYGTGGCIRVFNPDCPSLWLHIF